MLSTFAVVASRRFSPVQAAAPWLLCSLGAAGCTANATEAPAPATIEAPALPAIRVGVTTVERRALEIDGSASGKLHAFKTATIAAEVPGRVTRRSVERGEAVERRDNLFKIDTRNSQLALQQAQANEAASAIDLDLAQRELDRGQQLLDGQDIAQSSFDQLNHSRDSARKRSELAELNRRVAAKSVADARVRAPFDGTVVRLHAEEGDYVGPGTPLATIADFSKLRLRIGLTASEVLALESRDTQTVDVSFASLGGTSVAATLHDVDPLVDQATGTYAAEFWLEQPDGAPLREGMVGRVVLETSEDAEVVVPRNSVIRHGAGFAVWVVDRGDGHEGTAERRVVTLGRHDATWTVVLSGLEEGDTVVTSGQFALAEGIAVELDEAGA